MQPGREATARPDPWRLSAIVFLLGVLAHLPVWWQYSNDPYSRTLVSDALSYDRWANRLAQDGLGQEPVFHQAPLYPFVLSGIHRALPAPVHGHAAIAVGVVLTSLAAALVVWLGALYFGSPAAGAVGALIVLLHGPFPFYSLKLLPVPLALATQALALVALGRAREKRTALAAGVAGACLGVAALVRSEVLLFASLAVVCIWFAATDQRRVRRSVLCAAFALGVAAGIGPATLHNLRQGDLVLVASSGGENLYIGNRRGARGDFSALHPKAGDLFSERVLARQIAEQEMGRALRASEVSASWRRKAIDEVLADPVDWLRLEARKLGRVLHPGDPTDIYSFPLERSLYLSALHAMPLPAWVVLACGIAGVARSLVKARRRAWPLAAFAAVHLLILLVFFVNTRLRLPFLFALAPFAGLALVAAARTWRERRRRPLLACAGILLIAAGISGAVLTRAQPRDLVRLASALSTQGRLDEGIGVLEPALSGSPPYALALDQAGWLLQKKGDLGGARESYLGALAAGMPEGRSVQTRTRLAMVLEKLGDLEGAAIQHDAAVADPDGDAGTYYERGMFWLRRGSRERAALDLAEAARRDPSWDPPRTALRGMGVE